MMTRQEILSYKISVNKSEARTFVFYLKWVLLIFDSQRLRSVDCTNAQTELKHILFLDTLLKHNIFK